MNAEKFIEALTHYYRRELNPFEVKVIARNLAGYSGEYVPYAQLPLEERAPAHARGLLGSAGRCG